MTILSLASRLKRADQVAPASGINTPNVPMHRLPSEPVLRVMQTAIHCLGPLAPSDAMVLSRMLNRLFEIEHDDGVGVALLYAKELAEVLHLQQNSMR